MKAFLEASLVSLTLRARTVFKKFLKKSRQFRFSGLLPQQTSTPTRQKVGFFYAKVSAEFNRKG